MDQAFEKVLESYRQRMRDDEVASAAIPREQFREHRDDFLLPVGEEAARFLHSLAVGLSAQRIVELGTSYGFSTLFLADAARETGGKLYTFDNVERKHTYAQARMDEAGLAEHVEWRLGDALELLREESEPIDFVLLDVWKNLYAPCFELVYPLLAPGGVIIADNMLHPPGTRPQAAEYRALVRSKPDLEAVLLPVGHGLDIAIRKADDVS